MTQFAGQAQPKTGLRHRAGCSPDMDDREFADWTMLLESRSGLFIAPERKSFLLSGLRARMRETGCRNYGDYYRYICSGSQDSEEWSLLVDCLTVHETCFFRHDSSMNLVRDLVLPDVLASGNSFAAWSAGCATGEEAYSLAMLIDFHLSGNPTDFAYRVIGTDISLPSLRHASAGVYLNRRLRNVNELFRERYFRSVSEARVVIRERLRERVKFLPLNLRDLNRAPFANLDLVFCQNLLIYYDRARRRQLVDRLAGFLRPRGVLVLGPGEVLNWQHPNMEKVRYDDTLAYRRTD